MRVVLGQARWSFIRLQSTRVSSLKQFVVDCVQGGCTARGWGRGVVAACCHSFVCFLTEESLTPVGPLSTPLLSSIITIQVEANSLSIHAAASTLPHLLSPKGQPLLLLLLALQRCQPTQAATLAIGARPGACSHAYASFFIKPGMLLATSTLFSL